MLATTRQLIGLRRSHAALRVGALEVAQVDDGLLHLVRRDGGSTVHAVFNLGNTSQALPMADAEPRTLWTFGARPGAHSLHVPPGSAWYGFGDR